MAKPTTQRLKLPWALLPRALSPRTRATLGRSLGQLLAWQRRLDEWPRIGAAPDATPFVSLYARGRLVGCVGDYEGAPGARMTRAFLRALHDPRTQVLPHERGMLRAELSYLTAAHALPGDLEQALAQVEVGTHGLAWVAPDPMRSALLLPQVARDHGWAAGALLDALCDKARVRRDELHGGVLYRLTAETIVANAGAPIVDGAPLSLAARWLGERVAASGAIDFALDARSGERIAHGPMHHGRAAVVLEAIAGTPQHARAARRLTSELRAGLRGAKPAGWPDEEAAIAGTLALAVRAGLPFADALVERASSPRLADSPWHAAQVVAALGPRAPSTLWERCVADLARRPFAPWTAIAALARDDLSSYARAGSALRAAIGERGGVALGAVPEIALTAVTVEALAAGPASRESAAAIARGRAFLTRWQFLPRNVPAALDPRAAVGAFPASPVAPALRSDITAHALLALRGRRP